MFRRVQFPPESIADILAVTALDGEQLDRLNGLMNTAAAVEPVERSFLNEVAEQVNVDEDHADQLIRIGIILKRLNLEAEAAAEVIDDMAEAVRIYVNEDEPKAAALEQINQLKHHFISLATLSEVRLRVEHRRHIQRGTQPAIEEIRTLVQLRPHFQENENRDPIGIDCLVPAMTLELKFTRDEKTQSATFSLNQAKLQELIDSLHRAQRKWDLMHATYGNLICGED